MNNKIINWLYLGALTLVISACGGGGGSDGPPPNQNPTASAGADQNIAEASTGQLDGTASSDPESSTLTYTWTQTGGASVTLSSNQSAQPTFLAPNIATGAADLVLQFQLVVNDGVQNSTADLVDITIPNSNQTPNSSAGVDQSAAGLTAVTLDGGASNDADQDTLTYLWAQVSGTTVTLDDVTSAQPQFTAADVVATEVAEFQLIVNDGTVDSALASIQITIQPATKVVFDPVGYSNETGTIPAPNNYWFTGSTDKTLNVPGTAFIQTVNVLDGASTTNPIRIDFDNRINPASIVAGDNARVFEVVIDSDTRRVLSIQNELVANTDYIVEGSKLPEIIGQSALQNKRVLIKPLLPLKSSSGTGDATGYLVVLTNSIQDENGFNVQSNPEYRAVNNSTSLLGGSLAALEELRIQTSESLQLLSAFAPSPVLDMNNIAVSFSFSTESTTDALEAVASAATSRPILNLVAENGHSNTHTYATIYSGDLIVPNYLTGSTFTWNSSLGSRVTRYNPMPVANVTDASWEFYAALPKDPSCVKPTTGWPTVIYIGGGSGSPLGLISQFTGGSANTIQTVADELAEQCKASISLRSVPVPTGVPIPRQVDTQRQTLANLLQLVRTIPNIDFDINPLTKDLDGDGLGLIGHSGGGTFGLMLTALEPKIIAASIGSPDVGFSKSRDGSPLRSPPVEQAILSSGFEKGSSTYELIMGVIQGGYEAIDPLNYVGKIRANQAIHLVEIYGGGILPGDNGTGVGSGYTDAMGNFLNPGDLTTPPHVLNKDFFVGQVVETTPLAGIESVARIMNLSSAFSSIDNRPPLIGGSIKSIVRFTRGHHTSAYLEILGGFGDIAISYEWRNQHKEFIASDGLYLPIDTSPSAYVMQTEPQ